MPVKDIDVDYIARVEGQGQLRIRTLDGNVDLVEFGIFEPPKFFEAFLLGRKYTEVHELTSRICGICPVPHQIAALRAVENAMGIEVSEQTEALRKLLSYGSHIQSHVLSLYFLTAPDYLGYDSIITMAKDKPQLVKRALKLKKLGNDIEEVVGARAVHPTAAVVGGFTEIPKKRKMEELKRRLVDSMSDAVETARFASRLELPKFERRCEHIALGSNNEYPIIKGRLVSTEGLNVEEVQYRQFFKESQVDYSWAKHSTVVDRGSFLVGPLARVNLNHKRMSERSQELLDEAGFKPLVFNPFMHVVARAAEVANAVETSIEIIDNLKYEDEAVVEDSFKPKAGEGYAVVEAPRGILYHNYRFNDEGIVEKADIVTPTAHFARNVENDLREFVPQIIANPLKAATLRCEMLVRAYDPCISCSVHLQKVDKRTA